MKLRVILFLLINSMSFQSHSQIWVQPNAVWHYDYWAVSGWGFVKIEHIGDSLLQNKSTMMLQSTWFDFQMDQFGTWNFMGPQITDTNYVYTEGDTVFYFQNNQFQKLFDFSKNVGENYTIGYTDGGELCDTTSKAEVSNVGIDGLGYSFLTLSSPATSDLRIMLGNYNSRFGGGSFLFPQRYYNCDPQGIVDMPFFNFKCFQDDGMFYNPSGEDCEYLLTHLGKDEANQPNLNLFPNPAENTIKIQNESFQSSVVITNMNGEIIVELDNISNNTFDISFLSPGIYLLEFTTIEGDVSISRFIKK